MNNHELGINGLRFST